MLFGEIPPVCCWSILFIILIFVFIKVRKKIRQERRWKEYNEGLDLTANDWKTREEFIDEFTETTQKQRDERVRLEEEQNQLVYKAIRK